MKITRAVLREVPLELREWFEISSGGMQARRVILLTLEGDGVEGWSECVAGEDPGYSYETTDTAWLALTKWLLPAVVGQELEDARTILEAVSWVRGHRMAKAAVEMAAWDLEAKRRETPLATLLGGDRGEVPVGVSIGIQKTDDALLAKVEGHLEEGYRKIKVKVKPGRDAAMLEAVRARFPKAPLMADANSAYRLNADLGKLKAMDSLGLMMIEQPLAHDDYLDHARLQAQLETPVCLDESIRSVGDTRLALHLDSTRIVNIKPGRVGGLASSVAIHDTAREAAVPVWCGGMLESGIGRAHNVALATLPGFSIPGDISNSKRYWAEDIVHPEFEMVDGMMPVPEGPGIGVAPRLDRIESLTSRTEVFEG
ncbi:MAG: o-succinylbenzoate synthase [Gemmatimonadetes bacterium]|nr:o-succinylbenzoate synthase [Gemmatimonadota bacterium]